MQSIRFHLLIALLVTGLLPLSIVYFVMGKRTEDSLREGEYAKIKEMAVQVAGQLESVMGRAANDLQSLGSNPFLTNLNVAEEDREHEMNRLVGVYDKFSDITLYDPEGFILTSTTESQPENYEHSAWFKRALNAPKETPPVTIISDPHKVLNDPLGRLYLSVFIPVHGGDEVVMVVKARIPFDRIWELLNDVELGENGHMDLIDSRGNYLTHQYRDKVLSKFEEKFDLREWKKKPQGFFADGDDPELQSLYVSLFLDDEVTQVENREWMLIAFEPEEEVQALVVAQKRYQLGVAFATLIFVVALGYFLGSVFARPLIHASAVAGSVTRGETAARIADAGPKEVRELASSFNEMAEEVRHHRDRLQSLVSSRTKKLEDSQVRLRNLSAQLKASYDAAAEAILVIANDGAVIAANRRMKEFFGADPELIEGTDMQDVGERIFGCFADEEDFRKVWLQMASEPDSTTEAEVRVLRPRELILSMYSAPVRGRDSEVLARLWMFRDLTEQRHLQANLEQSQKMDAIGRLAGGVAHDFNNLLTGIIGNLSLIELDLDEGHSCAETNGYLGSAKKASQRAADLVRQLLGFSRQSMLRMRRCDVGNIIFEVRDLLHASIAPNIALETKVETDLWNVEADSTQIQQVLMNMCVNARDALPEGGGRIVMETSNVKIGRKKAALRGASGSEFVRFSISDNGAGIPPEVLEKIWEPFFTTKEQGKGTGLGLATSYGIVQQHGGWIDCKSTEGLGTTFSVFVPRKIYDNAEEQEKSADPVEGGSELVLLVDDEVMVRTVAKGFLKRSGYGIESASDGLEALEIIEERGEEIGLVLLDLTMPRLSGKDTFRKIREMYPDMPVVICSGYLLDIGEFENETGFRPSGMVQKPYKTEDLLSTVRKALDAKGTTADRMAAV